MAVIIISTLKGYFIHTVFIKCPITERCEKIKIINYRSTSWAIYSGLQPSNTLSRCSLAMNQTKSSKKGLVFAAFCLEECALQFLAHNPFRVARYHEVHHWRVLHFTISLNHHVCLTTVLNKTQEMSNKCTCNAGKDFADSYQHILRHLPPYG